MPSSPTDLPDLPPPAENDLGAQLLYRNAIKEAARELGRQDLGEWCLRALPFELWSKQREILSALSVPRSQVAVPSCNSSSKTFTAACAALAFYDSFPNSKIVTTSVSWDHLKDELWSEIRRIHEQMLWDLDGKLYPGALKIDGSPGHYVIGRSPEATESVQGYHAPQVLVVVDEATFLDAELAGGLESLRAAGDTRLLIIFNPTDDTTWAAALCNSPHVTVIPIDAWSTPNFTGEKVPHGADLIDDRWLQELRAAGHGPGTLMWTTRVEAKFWTSAEDRLVHTPWYDTARANPTPRGGQLVLGIDLAAYGSSENVIAFRRGNRLVALRAFPSMRQDIFWKEHVAPIVKEHKPAQVIYDGDGVGGGVYESAANACGEEKLIVVRSGIPAGSMFLNLRSAWWWRLRSLFENSLIAIDVDDPELRKQMLAMRYGFAERGVIRVESKEKMKTAHNIRSIDRADAVMYAFAFDAPDPPRLTHHPRSDEESWRRDLEALDRGDEHKLLNIVTGEWQ